MKKVGLYFKALLILGVTLIAFSEIEEVILREEEMPFSKPNAQVFWTFLELRMKTNKILPLAADGSNKYRKELEFWYQRIYNLISNLVNLNEDFRGLQEDPY